jgi:hypothetical protein
MTTPAPQQIAIPPGMVCCTTYGPIRHETVQCLLEMRSVSERAGLSNVSYSFIPGLLIEKARNEAVRQMLRGGMGWLLFVDGDMTFPPTALTGDPKSGIPGLLPTAYAEMPHADVIGAYCSLRGDLALPTIDSGSGTWESWYPGSGVVEVMRTGGAFLLVKRHVFEGLKDPWFRMRVPARPIDFMAEVDNWARIKWDGQNPFRNLPNAAWEKLEKAAQEDPSCAPEQFTPVEVGEDSGAADRMRNAGYRLFVHTDIVCGHVDTKITNWTDHKRAMKLMEDTNLQAVGAWR